jgi:hypothetical protein
MASPQHPGHGSLLLTYTSFILSVPLYSFAHEYFYNFFKRILFMVTPNTPYSVSSSSAYLLIDPLLTHSCCSDSPAYLHYCSAPLAHLLVATPPPWLS